MININLNEIIMKLSIIDVLIIKYNLKLCKHVHYFKN